MLFSFLFLDNNGDIEELYKKKMSWDCDKNNVKNIKSHMQVWDSPEKYQDAFCFCRILVLIIWLLF